MVRSRSRRRTRGTRRTRYTLLDHLMVAGIVGGGLYLFVQHAVPTALAATAGLLAFGFTLGASVRTPRLRPPLVWRGR